MRTRWTPAPDAKNDRGRLEGASKIYTHYEAVPWYRRSGPMGTITFLGLFFAPAILFSCLMVLTGDIYTQNKDSHGNLITWTFGNKFAAVIILIIQIGFTYAMLTGAFSR